MYAAAKLSPVFASQLIHTSWVRDGSDERFLHIYAFQLQKKRFSVHHCTFRRPQVTFFVVPFVPSTSLEISAESCPKAFSRAGSCSSRYYVPVLTCLGLSQKLNNRGKPRRPQKQELVHPRNALKRRHQNCRQRKKERNSVPSDRNYGASNSLLLSISASPGGTHARRGDQLVHELSTGVSADKLAALRGHRFQDLSVITNGNVTRE